MSTTQKRTIKIVISGDFAGTQEYECETYDDTAFQLMEYDLVGGSSPSFGFPSAAVATTGHRTRAVTIIKPSTYEGTLILKGTSLADDSEGVMLHPTDPDTISLDDTTRTTIVLKPSENVHLILLWT